MNKELEFNWKYFVDTGLKVAVGGRIGIFEYLMSKRILLLTSNKMNATPNIKNCKPLVVNPKDLSDEDLQYIFGVNFKVIRKQHLVYLRECRINLNTGYMQPCNQQILNRFYSLHSIPNYEELLKAGLIEDAGDCYEK